MPSDALLLVGRDTGHARTVLETHATRLVERDVVDAAHVATYDLEPASELRDQLAGIEADRVYAVPTSVAHTNDTVGELPAVLSTVRGELRYCEPLGHSPAVTTLLEQRAAASVPEREDSSLVLVGLGSSGTPHARQVVEYHADRLRDGAGFDEVVPCYLVQNPTVECVRYNVTNDRVVAVPVFLAACEATRERIPDKLELDRGGIEYAAPLGEHDLVTDAIEARIATQRAIASPGPEPVSYEDSLVRSQPRLAADGYGE